MIRVNYPSHRSSCFAFIKNAAHTAHVLHRVNPTVVVSVLRGCRSSLRGPRAAPCRWLCANSLPAKRGIRTTVVPVVGTGKYSYRYQIDM